MSTSTKPEALGAADETGAPGRALDHFSRAGALRGIRDALPLGLSVVMYGSVFGVLARQAGMSFAEAFLMSALVFAGSAQFVVIGMWAAPLPVLSIVLTTLAINLRHLLMGATLRPRFARFTSRQSYGSMMVMTDENWALALSRFERGERDGAFLLGGGIVMHLSWVLATVLGYLAGSAISRPEAIGLDFAATIAFAGLLVLLFKGKRDLLPWGVAAVVAVSADRLLPGNWYIILGGMAGCLAGAARYGR
jgi:4-azaleucine resistance transporter AzlC